MMQPTSFLSNLSARRLGRATSLDVKSSNVDDENHAVHEFQKCMDDVRREHPNLSIGAQKQMAINQCAKLNEDRAAHCQQRQMKRCSVPEDLLKGVMSKLHIGGNHCRTADADDGNDGIGTTMGSSTQASTVDGEKKEKSIAVCESVVISKDYQNMLAQMDWNESENDDSLQGSLEDIERSTSCSAASGKAHDRQSATHARSSSLNRFNRRASGLSSVGLFDLEEEDEESSRNTEDLDFLPDEIAVVLIKDCDGTGAAEKPNNDKDDVTKATAGQGRRKGGRASRGYHQSTINQSATGESNASSFLSVDSANFTGDFWAWRSVSSQCS